jgi:hypothetical protein
LDREPTTNLFEDSGDQSGPPKTLDSTYNACLTAADFVRKTLEEEESSLERYERLSKLTLKALKRGDHTIIGVLKK